MEQCCTDNRRVGVMIYIIDYMNYKTCSIINMENYLWLVSLQINIDREQIRVTITEDEAMFLNSLNLQGRRSLLESLILTYFNIHFYSFINWTFLNGPTYANNDD